MNLECLFAYSYLWAWGFCSMQEYNVHLDRLFSETPNNKILLELEECSNNYKEGELSSQVQHSIIKDLIGRSPT